MTKKFHLIIPLGINGFIYIIRPLFGVVRQ